MKLLKQYRFVFDPWGLLLFLLTLKLCLAFILFAANRKNLPAVLFATVYHCIFRSGKFCEMSIIKSCIFAPKTPCYDRL